MQQQLVSPDANAGVVTGVNGAILGSIVTPPANFALSGRSFRYAEADGAAGVSQLGGTGATWVQTASGVTDGGLASTDLRQASTRNQLAVNGVNLQFGVLWPKVSCLRGAVAKVGGFFFGWRIAFPQMLADSRFLIGLSPASIAATNPSANANTVGFGSDTADANMSLLSVDNGGAITKTAIGGGLSKVSLATGDPNTGFTRVLEWQIMALPNDNKVSCRIYDWSNEAWILGPSFTDIIATLPAAATFLRPQAFGSSGNPGGANTLALLHTYGWY